MANPSFQSASISAVIIVAVITLLQLRLLYAQQIYTNNKQLNCTNTPNYTLGYSCNGAETTCQSYLTFRSAAPNYTSIPSIAYLLSSEPSAMADLNQLTDVATISDTAPILVPVTCSCAGLYYQHNASYVLKFLGETYFSVANDTYQGLTTCQALIAQNPYNVTNLQLGDNLTAPLRCACPTDGQAAAGVKYLVTYITDWDDSVYTVAELFNVSEQSVLDANQLSATTTIFPFNPLLVPLTTEPTKIVVSPPPPPPASPPQTPVSPTTGSSSSKKSVLIGVGIGAGLVVILLVAFAVWFLRSRRDGGGGGAKVSLSDPPKKMADSVNYTAVPVESSSWSISTEGLREAIETLTLYRFEDLQSATGSFSEENRIKGSVFRGKFKGDDAAVKVLKGDVSSEINILRKINHSNIIRLSGFCVHQGNTYLVYEFAENGSLSDWLHQEPNSTLSWKQRIGVAFGVADAINYLHNYTNPPYIHKNLKSSNVLLDGNFRAKVANFGLARSVEEDDDGGLQLTRHVVGTQGYMAPEYIENGVITPKMDVFAFGVVILEILSGKEAAGAKKDREELLSTAINRVLLEGDDVKEKLRSFIDASLKDEYPLEMAFSMAELARRCVAYDLNSRPSIAEVLMTLSKIHSSSLDWDPSDELSSSRSLPMGHGR